MFFMKLANALIFYLIHTNWGLFKRDLTLWNEKLIKSCTPKHTRLEVAPGWGARASREARVAACARHMLKGCRDAGDHGGAPVAQAGVGGGAQCRYHIISYYII